MPDKKTPEALDDTALDQISGGPTEELFGAYHFLLETAGTTEVASAGHQNSGFIGETEKNVWKAPAGTEANSITPKRER